MNKSATLFPGDDIVTKPMIQLAYSIEIGADRAAIWPWLVQVGYHRGGWYIDRWSDRIEQQYFWPVLVPPEARGTWQPPADEILTEFQYLKIGDTIPDGPPGSAYYEVVALACQPFIWLIDQHQQREILKGIKRRAERKE